MFDKSMQYSYAAQKNQRYRVIKFFFIFLFFFILYNCITAFFFSVWVVENDTMQNAINSGDRIIFSSFKPPWANNKNDESSYPFRRGSIVLIDKRHDRDFKKTMQTIDNIVRFFSLQRASIFSKDGQFYVKRIIALPGDEISMNNYIFKVKTSANSAAAGGDDISFSLTEFELSVKPYHPVIPQTHIFWDESIPFSGHMDPVLLGPNQYFVVSDDRGNTNDSRTWGPIPASIIKARAVLRIWPLNKIELL